MLKRKLSEFVESNIKKSTECCFCGEPAKYEYCGFLFCDKCRREMIEELKNPQLERKLSPSPGYRKIPIDKLNPNPLQPRESFDREKLKELAGTISEVGILQPIFVRPKGDRYEIIGGERRYKASQIAGEKTIPALVKDLPDSEVMVQSLIENVHRENLKPVEQAKAILEVFKAEEGKSYRHFVDDKLSKKIVAIRDKLAGQHTTNELTEEEEVLDEIVKKIGLPHISIYEALGILKLPKSIQQEATEKEVGKRQLARISTIEDEELQKKVFRKMVDENLARGEISKLTTVVKKVSEPVKKAVLKKDSKITPEHAEKIMTVEKEDEQKQIIEKVEIEDLTPERTEKLIEIAKQSPEPVKKAMLKPKSKITPEIAEEIMKFDNEEDQKAMIHETLAYGLDEDSVRTRVTRILDHRRETGKTPMEVIINDPAKRHMMELQKWSTESFLHTHGWVDELTPRQKDQTIEILERVQARINDILVKLGAGIRHVIEGEAEVS